MVLLWSNKSGTRHPRHFINNVTTGYSISGILSLLSEGDGGHFGSLTCRKQRGGHCGSLARLVSSRGRQVEVVSAGCVGGVVEVGSCVWVRGRPRTPDPVVVIIRLLYPVTVTLLKVTQSWRTKQTLNITTHTHVISIWNNDTFHNSSFAEP